MFEGHTFALQKYLYMLAIDISLGRDCSAVPREQGEPQQIQHMHPTPPFGLNIDHTKGGKHPSAHFEETRVLRPPLGWLRFKRSQLPGSS